MKKSLIVVVAILTLGILAFVFSNAVDLQGKFSTKATDTTTNVKDAEELACRTAALSDLNSAITDFEDGLEYLDASFSTPVSAQITGEKDYEQAYKDLKENQENAEGAYDELIIAHDDISAAYKAIKACK